MAVTPYSRYGERVKRHLLLPLSVVVLGLCAPAAANASVQVLHSDSGSKLVAFKTAKCQKATKKGAILKFIATAKSHGYTLHVNIYQLSDDMLLTYGGDGPADFTVSGPGGSWSNLNRPPDAPPAGGAIVFNAKKTRLGLGFQPALNESLTSGIDLAGGLTCQYPKKKKHKRH
jgi:hypothetical protein